MIGVRKGTFKSMREVTDTELKNIMTVKIEYPHLNVRIVVAHAPQETAKAETRAEFFEELSVQVERCFNSGDELIVCGDLNARIKCEGSVIPEKDSPNGVHLSDLILKHELKVGISMNDVRVSGPGFKLARMVK